MPKIVKWLKGKPKSEGHYRCKFLRLDGKAVSNSVFYYKNKNWHYQENSEYPTDNKIICYRPIEKKEPKIKKTYKCNCDKPDIVEMEYTVICRNCDWCINK